MTVGGPTVRLLSTTPPTIAIATKGLALHLLKHDCLLFLPITYNRTPPHPPARQIHPQSHPSAKQVVQQHNSTPAATMGGGTKCPDAATAGFFNKLSFGWMAGVVRKAHSNDVDVHELPLPTEQTAEVAFDAFTKNWDAAVKAGNPKLRKVIWQSFGRDIMWAGTWKLLWSLW